MHQRTDYCFAPLAMEEEYNGARRDVASESSYAIPDKGGPGRRVKKGRRARNVPF